jgi:hypothetical protein
MLVMQRNLFDPTPTKVQHHLTHRPLKDARHNGRGVVTVRPSR